MKKEMRNSYGRAALYGACGYGGGLALGMALLGLILRLELVRLAVRLAPDGQPLARLVVSLGLGLALVGAAGAVGGSLGGWALSRAFTVAAPQQFMRRHALSLGLALSILAPPLFLLTAVGAFYYEPASLRPLLLIALFTFYGCLYGLLTAVFLAIFSGTWRRWRRILAASAAGFSLGGGLIGLFIHRLLSAGFFSQLPDWLFAAWLCLLLGSAGGAALGLVYRWLAAQEAPPAGYSPRRRRPVVIVMLVMATLTATWNLSNASRLRDANSQAAIVVGAVGTHWAAPRPLDAGRQPAIFTADNGAPYIVWVQDSNIFYAPPTNGPVHVAHSPVVLAAPAGAADSAGNVHLVWQGEEGDILYGRCHAGSCQPPQPLAANCVGVSTRPTIAIDAQGTLVVVWSQGTSLAYAAWPAAQTPQHGAAGCVISGGNPQNPRVAASDDGRYLLVFEDNGRIFTSELAGSGWSPPLQIGHGHSPNVYVNNDLFLAWCSPEQQVVVQGGAGDPETITFPSCHGRPALAQDSNGVLHAVWYSTDVVKSTSNIVRDQSLIYESVKRDGVWLEAAIIARTATSVTPEVAAADGSLHLVWEEGTAVFYATQTAYNCANRDLNPVAQAVQGALNQPTFKAAGPQQPACGHRYEALLGALHAPVDSNSLPSSAGAFDQAAEVAQTAAYELLIATRQWHVPTAPDSGGTALAQAIVALYEKVKENPAHYPRGMTVRILTGGAPALFAADDQAWRVLADLRAAGLPELVDAPPGWRPPGWRVEIATFDGAWPGMHANMLVVDGRRVLVGGSHNGSLPLPPGQGNIDWGIQLDGPAAQAARAAYDDLWGSAALLVCDELGHRIENLWKRRCRWGTAVGDHVPEVLRYETSAEGTANAYALYRSHNHLAGATAVEAAIRAADEKIDIFTPNFSLDLLCAVAILFQDICNYEDNALPDMVALVETIDAGQIPVRLLVQRETMHDAENRIGIEAFVAELEKRGLQHLVEIRFYAGKIHNQVINIDGEFLIAGSQSFHYSAWGESGPVQFSLGTDDRQAIADFEAAFTSHWQSGIPAQQIVP